MREPLSAKPSDLPEIRQEQVDEFLEYCKTRVPRRERAGQPVAWVDLRELTQERRIWGVDAAARQIADLQRGHRHLIVLSVTGYLVEAGYDPGEIAVFVDRWFPDHLRDEEWRDVYGQALKFAEGAVRKGWNSCDWEMSDA